MHVQDNIDNKANNNQRELCIVFLSIMSICTIYFSRNFATIVSPTTGAPPPPPAAASSTSITSTSTTGALLVRSTPSTNASSSRLSHQLDYNSCANNSILPEYWCLDVNHIPRYVAGTRKEILVDNNNNNTIEIQRWPPKIIQHYTHEGYDKCLGNKTVVFIGDSRVRYQYMHLARFLNTKKPLRCQDYEGLPKLSLNWTTDNTTELNWHDRFIMSDPDCYLIDEKLFHHGWTAWYQQSTNMLNSNTSSHHSNESISTAADKVKEQSSLCDCFRPVPFRPKSTFENRFIKRSTVYGTTNLIYLQNFENYISMNGQFPPYSSFDSKTMMGKGRCSVGECNDSSREIAFQGNLNDTLWQILPRLNTTHAFVNLGWEHLFPFEMQSKFSCVIQEFERHHPDINIYLISHPPHVSALSNPLVSFDATKLKCDIKVLDRTSMSKNAPSNWYWDGLHVLSILNEEYNHQLVIKYTYSTR
mmetsp:Transcript_4174/g.7977  ORF Transcript_4174/g.7977 Transcript_4174/m.7977 type:complete len:473 (+) Transcript_4174:2423-3841(+)